jgi:hypothetical protein
MGKGKNSYFDALKDPIQLVGKSSIALTKKEVFVNKKLYLEDFFNDFDSEYIELQNNPFLSKKNASDMLSILDKIQENKLDIFFLAGKIINEEHTPFISFQDIKRYRGKTSGTILHINRSELSENISLEFYRMLYKEWKFKANLKRYMNYWKDIDSNLELNYSVKFDKYAKRRNNYKFFIKE